MVIPLGPGKFYGNSLPRPRYYTDVKYNTERVDPPISVLDPFLTWANDAHWSMGGLSHKRLRLQGRIEGNAKRLRNEIELREVMRSPVVVKSDPDLVEKRSGSVSPPHAPVAMKRRRRRMLIESSDDDEDDDVSNRSESEVEEERGKGRVARKLAAEFDKVATKRSGGDVTTTVVDDLDLTGQNQRKKAVKLSKNGAEKSRIRSSPRLAKRKLI